MGTSLLSIHHISETAFFKISFCIVGTSNELAKHQTNIFLKANPILIFSAIIVKLFEAIYL